MLSLVEVVVALIYEQISKHYYCLLISRSCSENTCRKNFIMSKYVNLSEVLMVLNDEL